MRKEIVTPQSGKEGQTEQGWLDLEDLATVEITSEDPSHPVESALTPGGSTGWRAAEPGPQVIRLLFDHPQRVKRIYLLIKEEERTRTQELVLRSSQDHGSTYREIVRQQYNFTPPGTVTEEEEYHVNLDGVTALELEINPDVGGSVARAKVARLRVG